MLGTINYYQDNSIDLIERYNNADMSSLHQLLNNHLDKPSKVLDIGFGSGRDLEFLYNAGHNIWGIDATKSFVENAKKKFPDISTHFIQASLPFKSLFINTKFDSVISIAMWMHLKKEDYCKSVESITKLLNKNATIVISFSRGKRNNDERYFEDVDIEYLNQLFLDKGFKTIEQIETKDALKRDTLSWITLVYKND